MPISMSRALLYRCVARVSLRSNKLSDENKGSERAAYHRAYIPVFFVEIVHWFDILPLASTEELAVLFQKDFHGSQARENTAKSSTDGRGYGERI